MRTSRRFRARIFSALLPIFFSVVAISHAQTPACTAVEAHTPTPAENAYSESRFADAENLYQQALAQQPKDTALSAGLVKTLLRENKIAPALAQANAGVAANGNSAATLTALAEVEYRQGLPWLASGNLEKAVAADPCYARAHFVRSRLLRIDSMYASERAELQRAYDIDPTDPDIQSAWLRIDQPAHDIESTTQSLATMKDIDDTSRQRAEANVHAQLPLLSENSQTCKVVPATAQVTLPLMATMADGKHIDGYRLDAQLPQTKARLIVDTSASGLYISKALADQNGFHAGAGDPPNTVRADSLKIGPLEFRDCTVGVSEAPFAGKADGFIGTDIFAPYLVTLDLRLAKMTLAPLPEQASVLPIDRTAAASQLAGFTPVYHRRQYLLVPLTFGKSERRLFVLATGMRFSAMSPEVAHTFSKMTVNFTNTEQTAQGGKAEFYREIFDLQFAGLPQVHQGHILDLDPAVINHNAGFELAGMLGLDMLQGFVLQLDYRDGLVKFEVPRLEDGGKEKNIAVASAASAAETTTECPPMNMADRPVNSTIEAKVTGTLESGRLKPGKEIWVQVVHGVEFPNCTLEEKDLIYGHVLTSTKDGQGGELAVLFDHGDCESKGKQTLALKLIGLVAPPDEKKHMHDAMPTEVAGGGRQIQSAVAGTNAADEDLNPGGPPHTVHPGIVSGMADTKLEPQGGPQCSARITTANRAVQLGVGAELLFTMVSSH